MPTIEEITSLIEEARREGTLGNDAARAASVALTLEGDDAMLANRVLAQGADPASIEYLVRGEVSPHVALAHRQGPGSLKGEERRSWLELAALSADESKESLLIDRVTGFAHAHAILTGGDDTRAQLERGADRLEATIKHLKHRMLPVGGRSLRVYTTDLGFASAYWQGERAAAVLGSHNGEPYVAVGCVPETTLGELGIEVDKPLGPQFGIIENPAAVAAIKEAL